jgi:predicted RNA binding protein YcfA (HicA-like mRNA interferase family)
MQKKVGTTTITVPVPNHKEIKIGTLKSIIRQSKLPSSGFEL